MKLPVTTSSVFSSNLTSNYPGHAFSITLFSKPPVNAHKLKLHCSSKVCQLKRPLDSISIHFHSLPLSSFSLLPHNNQPPLLKFKYLIVSHFQYTSHSTGTVHHTVKQLLEPLNPFMWSLGRFCVFSHLFVE